MEEIVNKIREIKKLHRIQVNQLDLNVETSPRDSRYSQQLLEMMKKEELLLNKEPTSPTTRAMTAKVDEGLRSETQAFFAKLVSQNIRKWEILREKLAKSRASLNNEVIGKQHMFSSQVESNVASTSMIELEEDRLLADYYKNWLQYEGFHLNQAFQSQQARIDNDWSVHEKNLQQEYSVKKASIVGSSVDAFNDSSHLPDDSRWQHPEKQKTLIHTAPVFTPQRPTSARKSTVHKKRDNYSNIEVSLAFQLIK